VAELGGFAGALAAFEGDEPGGCWWRGHGVGLAKPGQFVTRAGWHAGSMDGKTGTGMGG
jgi:hypothetical protein